MTVAETSRIEVKKTSDRELIDTGIRSAYDIVIESLKSLGVVKHIGIFGSYAYTKSREFEEGRMKDLPWPFNMDGIFLYVGRSREEGVQFAWTDGNFQKKLFVHPGFKRFNNPSFEYTINFSKEHATHHDVDVAVRFEYSKGEIDERRHHILFWKKVGHGAHIVTKLTEPNPRPIGFHEMTGFEGWALMQKIAGSLEQTAIKQQLKSK